jgi:rare lipoprotein A
MRVNFISIVFLFATTFFFRCHDAWAEERRGIGEGGVKVTNVLKGTASYYHGKWIGRKTANGEIYKKDDITAAHKTLPFNTMARVTNLRNGKEVVVRINNRGPYVKGRIIDLSLAAAEKISMTKAGVVPVKVEILERPKDGIHN